MTTLTVSYGSMGSETNQAVDHAAGVIDQWLRMYIGRILEMPPDEVDSDEKFDRFGIDSSAAVGMVGDLEAWIGCELDPALPYDHPTIASMATELSGRIEIRVAIAGKIA